MNGIPLLNPDSLLAKWPWVWRGSTFIGLAVMLVSLGIAGLLLVPGQQRGPFLDMAAVGSIILGMLAFGLWLRRLMIRRHGFRILEQTTQIVFKMRDSAVARVMVHEHGVYQALVDGQRMLRIRKYVRQPATMRGETLLSTWNYTAACEAGPSGKDSIEPQAYLSEARALDLEFNLPEALSEGENIQVNESLEFTSELFQPKQSLQFPISLPTLRRRIVFLFEGVHPDEIMVELADGAGSFRPIPLQFSETETGAIRGIFDWPVPKVGEEARIAWSWSQATVGAARQKVTGLTPEELAELIDETSAQRLVKDALAEDAAADAAASDLLPSDIPPDDAGQLAEDHPLIKAARARLGAPRKET